MQNEANERAGHPGISPCAADRWTGDRCVAMADRYAATPHGPVPACPDCARVLAAAYGSAPEYYYAVNRYLVFGNGDDTPYETIDTQYSCFWSLAGAQADASMWARRGWATEIDGPYSVAEGMDLTGVRP